MISERERETEKESERELNSNNVERTVDFPGGSDSKESSCQCRRPRFDPWVRKISWRRERLPTPVFLPGKSHGRRSLVGYSRWSHKESDTAERLKHTHPPPPQREQLISTFTFILWHIMQAFQLFTRWVEIYGKLCDIMIHKSRKIFITHG